VSITLYVVTHHKQEHNFPDHSQIPQNFKLFHDGGHLTSPVHSSHEPITCNKWWLSTTYGRKWHEQECTLR